MLDVTPTAATRRSRRVRLFAIVAQIAAFALSLAALPDVRLLLAAAQAERNAILAAIVERVPWPMLVHPVTAWTRGILLAPHLFAAIALILVAEWRLPARRQALISPALVNDFIWFVAQIGFVLGANVYAAEALQTWYLQHAAITASTITATLPNSARLAIGILLGDFLDWLHHFVRHKVPVLWWFHTVHHAQTDMNTWTNHRVHPLDYIAGTLVRVVPATILAVSIDDFAAWGLFAAWYTRLYHANIRSNFGLLRFVLVTPQSHRVHHSRRPEHQDTNFGVLFSLWDRLCGTQCRDDTSYPETGIDDPTFPHERGWSRTLSLRAFLAQHIYPLRRIWQWYTGNRSQPPRVDNRTAA